MYRNALQLPLFTPILVYTHTSSLAHIYNRRGRAIVYGLGYAYVLRHTLDQDTHGNLLLWNGQSAGLVDNPHVFCCGPGHGRRNTPHEPLLTGSVCCNIHSEFTFTIHIYILSSTSSSSRWSGSKYIGKNETGWKRADNVRSSGSHFWSFFSSLFFCFLLFFLAALYGVCMLGWLAGIRKAFWLFLVPPILLTFFLTTYLPILAINKPPLPVYSFFWVLRFLLPAGSGIGRDSDGDTTFLLFSLAKAYIFIVDREV